MYTEYKHNSIYLSFPDDKTFSVSEDGMGGAINLDWDGNVVATRPRVPANRDTGEPAIPSLKYYDTYDALAPTSPLSIADYLIHTGMAVSSLSRSSYNYKETGPSSRSYPPRVNNLLVDLKDIITGNDPQSYMVDYSTSNGGSSGWTHTNTTIVNGYYYRIVLTAGDNKYAVLQADSAGTSILLNLYGGNPDSLTGIPISVSYSVSIKGAKTVLGPVVDRVFVHGTQLYISASPQHLCMFSRDITKNPYYYSGIVFSNFTPNYSWLVSKGVHPFCAFAFNSTGLANLANTMAYSSNRLNPPSTTLSTGSSAQYMLVMPTPATSHSILKQNGGSVYRYKAGGSPSISALLVAALDGQWDTNIRNASGDLNVYTETPITYTETGSTSSNFLLNPINGYPYVYSSAYTTYSIAQRAITYGAGMILIPIGIVHQLSGTQGNVSTNCHVYLIAGHSDGIPAWSNDDLSQFGCDDGRSYVRVGSFAIGID